MHPRRHRRGAITDTAIGEEMLARLSATRLSHTLSTRVFGARLAHTLPQHTIFLPAGSSDAAPAQTTLPAGDTPIACMLGWVGCREKAMRKYAALYTKPYFAGSW